MTYAITPRGVGLPVGARAIEPGWPLAAGETFAVNDWHEGLVLAEDGLSLREAQPDDPPPAPIRRITPRALIGRLPQAKCLRIVTAAQADPEIALWLHMTVGGPVDLDHERTIHGIDHLVAAGLLDAADKAALLAHGTPDELP